LIERGYRVVEVAHAEIERDVAAVLDRIADLINRP
jgi:very-short-patch-repair endonuclease